MARISSVPQTTAGWFARLLFRISKKRFGTVLASLPINAHHGGILFGVAIMENAQAKARLLPLRLKEIASIRAATLIGCPY